LSEPLRRSQNEGKSQVFAIATCLTHEGKNKELEGFSKSE